MPDPSDDFLACLRPHYTDALRYCRGFHAAGSPGDPSVSDRELQRFIDDQIERLDLPPSATEARWPPRVERLPDGRRILREGPMGWVLTPETRIWIRPDVAWAPFQVSGVHDLLHWTGEEWIDPLRDVERP